MCIGFKSALYLGTCTVLSTTDRPGDRNQRRRRPNDQKSENGQENLEDADSPDHPDDDGPDDPARTQQSKELSW